MRLSDDKVNHISHLVANILEEDDGVVLLKSKNSTRIKIREIIRNELFLDEKLDQIVRSKISKKIIEGSRQWDVLYDKLMKEELAKRGR